MISEALEDGVSNDDPEYGRFFNEWLDARSEELGIGVSKGDDRYVVESEAEKKHALNAKRLIRRLRSIYRAATDRAARIEKGYGGSTGCPARARP